MPSCHLRLYWLDMAVASKPLSPLSAETKMIIAGRAHRYIPIGQLSLSTKMPTDARPAINASVCQTAARRHASSPQCPMRRDTHGFNDLIFIFRHALNLIMLGDSLYSSRDAEVCHKAARVIIIANASASINVIKIAIDIGASDGALFDIAFQIGRSVAGRRHHQVRVSDDFLGVVKAGMRRI